MSDTAMADASAAKIIDGKAFAAGLRAKVGEAARKVAAEHGVTAGLAVVLVGEEYWRRLFDVAFLVAEGVIDPEDRKLFWFAETAQETWDGIRAAARSARRRRSSSAWR